jgi:hypothetical protein
MNQAIHEALDALALALVDHGHQWTDKQRALYEEATASCDDYTGFGSSVSVTPQALEPLNTQRLPSAQASNQ